LRLLWFVVLLRAAGLGGHKKIEKKKMKLCLARLLRTTTCLLMSAHVLFMFAPFVSPVALYLLLF